MPALIWGSTWFAIKFQLGVVAPLFSVSYRFVLASLLMFMYCRLLKLNLKFSLKDHLFIALQGLFLFGMNYWLVYLAEQHLTSGLVAIAYSMLIFLNIFFNRLIMRASVQPRVVIGALLGVSGVSLIFQKELSAFNLSDENFIALLLCFTSVVLASLGNVLSAFNQKRKLPVLQTNAFGMLYGGLIMALFAFVSGQDLSFDLSPPYLLSLLYLSLFGSVIAFSLYLNLIGNIGPDKAAYVTLIMPVIALFISSFFEGFKWDALAITGLALILSGNFLVLKRKKKLAIS